MTNSTKLQAVMNTLSIMEIKPTFDNTNKLLGIYQTLMEVQGDLIARGEEAEEDGGDHGETDPE